MKTLLIMRHAKSSWKDDDLPDHDRPLNKRGKSDAPAAGNWLRQEELLPDLILCSTAQRARSTAEAVSEASGYEGEIQYSRDLYAASPEDYLEALASLPDRYERVMLIGHNPGLGELLEELTEEVETFPTAALAEVQLPITHWSEITDSQSGKLARIWRPKDQNQA